MWPSGATAPSRTFCGSRNTHAARSPAPGGRFRVAVPDRKLGVPESAFKLSDKVLTPRMLMGALGNRGETWRVPWEPPHMGSPQNHLCWVTACLQRKRMDPI